MGKPSRISRTRPSGSGVEALRSIPFYLPRHIESPKTARSNSRSSNPDRYGVVIDGLPNGFYTKGISAGGVDVRYSGVDLTSGSAAPIDILVSPKAGLVSGAALNPDSSQPTPGATVVLVPKEKERLAIFEFYQQATTDQYGRFTFTSVVPGEYSVYAWEDVESSSWMDPEFMKALEAKGEAVKVEESAQASVQVTIIPADSGKDRPQ